MKDYLLSDSGFAIAKTENNKIISWYTGFGFENQLRKAKIYHDKKRLDHELKNNNKLTQESNLKIYIIDTAVTCQCGVK